MQLDLFKTRFHSIHVYSDGRKSTVLKFHDKDEMRRVAISKMRLDQELIAYCILCMWTGEKVIALETIYQNDKEIYKWDTIRLNSKR